MSTTAPPPTAPLPPAKSGGTNKILLGCGAGCLLLILLLVIALGAFWMKVVKPMQAAGEEIEAMMKANQETIDQIAALDSSYPSSLAEDLDGAVLTASQVDGYIAIRQALGPQAAAVADARAVVADSLDMSGVGNGGTAAMGAVFGMMSSVADGARAQMNARAALLESAATELDSASMGPSELAALVEIVEWRFLQKEGAISVALTEQERADWSARAVQLRVTQSLLEGAGAQMGEADRAKFERGVEEASERLDDLRAVAAERKTLSAATVKLLESRRSELEALPENGLIEFATLTESSNPMKALEGLGALGG